MRTWVKGTAPAALLALGVMSLGGGTAFADTVGDHSVGGGNQIDAPIALPIDISGNAVAVAGKATGSSQGGASVDDSTDGSGSGIPGKTSGKWSVLGGNQVKAPINAPVNACGNAVSLFGGSEASCRGGSSVKKSGRGGGGAGGNRTSGDHSVLGGNQVVAPITAPINACGNAVAIFGDAVAGCRGGSSVTRSGGGGRGAGGNTTSGRASVVGGNQVVAPITAPANVCGNAVAVLGHAFAGCKGGVEVPGGEGPGRPGRPGWPGKPGYPGGHPGGHPGWQGPRPGSHQGAGGNDTDGRFAVGSGNQVVAPITAPINACGNAVGNAEASCVGGSGIQGSGIQGSGQGRGVGGNTTSGRGSVLGGNQVVAPITAPANVCGNAVAVLGHAFAGCRGGASIKSGSGAGAGAGGNRTNGHHSVLGGNQVVAPITAPINACGNAVAALGDAAAGCLGGSHVGASGDRLSGQAHAGNGRWNVPGKHRTSGLMSVLPAAPGLNSAKGTGDLVRQASGSGASSLPAVDGVRDMAGLPQLPQVPGDVTGATGRAGVPDVTGVTKQAGVPDVTDVADSAGVPDVTGVTDAAGVSDVSGVSGRSGASRGAQSSPRKGDSPLAVANGLVPSAPIGKSLPVGGALPVGKSLPVGGDLPVSGALPVGLMSAAQPVGVTGMNAGSLLALVLGAMAAASATLFVTARRIRFAKR
ncbi:chaplin family protein [Streptosporangium sp. NPDC051023]|uniref:chaplin family protein n=1 Tax=Streptosporangium sp. NPDC051023 TaxID=3155410 RepID=UPI00344F96F0